MDPAPLPFNNGKRVRRRIRMGACSDVVRELVEGLPYQFMNANVPYIYGAVDVSVGFIYSHSKRLGDLDREQYRHWRKLGVSGEDQWFFNFESSAALPEPVELAHYVARRFKRVFCVLTNDIVEELCDMIPNVPQWLAAERGLEYHLAVLLPEAFAVCSMENLLEFLVVPSLRSRGCWWSPPKWMQDMFNLDLCQAFEATRRPIPANLTAFSMTSCNMLADDLRSVLLQGLAGNEDKLFRWICGLQESDDALFASWGSDKLAVASQMIELVRLADKLRDTGNLSAVMRKALEVVLPSELRDMCPVLLRGVQKLSKSQISRARLTLDVGFMLHKRVENWLNPDKIRFLMWDSSPQFGRDYQMALVQEVKKDDLPVALRSLLRMETLFVGDAPDFGDDEAFVQTRADMDILRKIICLHAVPSVLIGFGAASFSHKLWSLLHAIRLETFLGERVARLGLQCVDCGIGLWRGAASCKS